MVIPLIIVLCGLGLGTVYGASQSGPVKQTGTASWYGAECSRTATGAHYNPNTLTAAHKTLPLGTLVQVHNLDNGCSVTVRINNRGPYRKGRIIDVSKAAARQLQMLHSGTANVEVVVVNQ